MMLILDTPIASARNDAGESAAPRSVERALRRMGFPAAAPDVCSHVTARSDADWTPLRDTARADGHGSRACMRTCSDEPATDWRPL